MHQDYTLRLEKFADHASVWADPGPNARAESWIKGKFAIAYIFKPDIPDLLPTPYKDGAVRVNQMFSVAGVDSHDENAAIGFSSELRTINDGRILLTLYRQLNRQLYVTRAEVPNIYNGLYYRVVFNAYIDGKIPRADLWVNGVKLKTREEVLNHTYDFENKPQFGDYLEKYVIGYSFAGALYNKEYRGNIDNVGLWKNVNLNDSDIKEYSTTDHPETILDKNNGALRNAALGYWPLNNNLEDISPHKSGQTFNVRGNSTYFVVSDDNINFKEQGYHVIIGQDSSGSSRRKRSVSNEYTAIVESNTGLLIGTLSSSQTDAAFPEGIVMRLTDPDGNQINQEVLEGSDRFIKNNEDGTSLRVFCIRNPKAGDWIIELSGSSSEKFFAIIQTLPAGNPHDVANAMLTVTQQIVVNNLESHDRVPRAWWHWLATALSVALEVGGVVITVASGGTLAPLGIFMAGTGMLGSVIFGTEAIADTASSSMRISQTIAKNTGSSDFNDEVAMPVPSTGQGSVQLLIDGANYFPVLRNLFLAVKAGSFNSDRIGSISNPTFENLAKQTAAAGKTVRVLMWEQTRLYNLINSNAVLKDLFKLYILNRRNDVNSNTRKALSGINNLTVLEEIYTSRDATLDLSSQHQKLVVASVGGIKAALVSGFNIITPEYYDDADHPMHADSGGHRNFHSWHDTGFLIQGPVVSEVEKEFDRRWSKSVKSTDQDNDLTGDYIKVAAWNIEHTSCLDNYSVCASNSDPTPYKTPIQPSPHNYSIDVKITNSESNTRITEILDTLLEKIESARNYIYFENCAFFDYNLYQGLANSLKANRDLKLFVNTVYPRILKNAQPSSKGYDSPIQVGQFFFTSIMQKLLILSDLSFWSSLSSASGRIIHSSEVRSSHFIGYRPITSKSEIDLIDWKIHLELNSGSTEEIPIIKIINVDQNPNNMRIYFSAPARYFSSGIPHQQQYQLEGVSPNFRSIYIHSKLALIDDRYALCGSANFTARSMLQDGECSVGVNDSNTVRSIKEQVLSHWNIPNGHIENIISFSENFKSHPNDGVGLLPLPSSVLTKTGYPVDKFQWYQSLIDDPDYLL